MNTAEEMSLKARNERALETFRTLTPEEKLQELKAIGILDDEGNLSSRYGGNGRDTGSEPRYTKSIARRGR